MKTFEMSGLYKFNLGVPRLRPLWAVLGAGLMLGLLMLPGAPAVWAAPEPVGSHPHIYSLSKTYANIGQQMTIRGIDFGPTAPVSAGTGVLFNYDRTTHTGVRAAVVSWSNTTIVCTVPNLASTVRISEVGVVTDRHKSHAGAPPVPDRGATTETYGTPTMKERLRVVIARAPYQITEQVTPTVTIVRPSGYPADVAGQIRWGDTLQLTVELRFTLPVSTYRWRSWSTYNNDKPVYLYLIGPDLDPRAPGYEARWEGRLRKYLLKLPAAIDRVERIGTGSRHRMWISNYSAAVADVARPLCVGPYYGNDGQWGWRPDRSRDDIPWTPGEWRLVGVLIPLTLEYLDSSGARVAVDTHASTVTTFTGRRIAFDNNWADAVENPYIVTVQHPLDLNVSANGGGIWERFGSADRTANGNRRLLPASPAGTVPRLWFSTPIPEYLPWPDPAEGASPGALAGLWPNYRVQAINQSHLRLGTGSGAGEVGGLAMDVPDFTLAPINFPGDPRFYAAYPNSYFPRLSPGSVRAQAAFLGGGGTARADPTRDALNLQPEPPTGSGPGIATVEDMVLHVPAQEPSVAALLLAGGGVQPAYYATTAALDPWTGVALDPQPSVGVAGDYTALEARLYDRFLAKVFVNSDGSADAQTGALTANLANIGPLLDLSSADVSGAPQSLLGFWNLYYDENVSADPFAWLYEEAYRSLILAASVRGNWDLRLFG